MRVAVGMSGGVDSSVTAALLKEQGHNVTGVFIEAYNEPGCRTDEDKRDALRVATQLGIPFQVLDLRKEYKATVVKYFFGEYLSGRTPNPDVVCNREVKFGLFYDWAIKRGFANVATGHYARITEDGQLQQPVDLTKDQSYFLWQVPREHLTRVMWPLGEMTKQHVRAYAKHLKLPNADKPDSMGVCMLGELNVRAFLHQHLGEQPGDVIWNGRVVGNHEGLWFYTIGQRGGWEYSTGVQTEKMPSLYVIDKHVDRHELVIGLHGEAWRTSFTIVDHQLWGGGALSVRIRNLGEIVNVTDMTLLKGGQWRVNTDRPLYGPAAGQSAVFYSKGVVVGGGILSVSQTTQITR